MKLGLFGNLAPAARLRLFFKLFGAAPPLRRLSRLG